MLVYKDYLQSRPTDDASSTFSLLGVKFEDVLDLPIKYLELPAQASYYLLGERNRFSIQYVTIKKIRDLFNLGYDKLESFLVTYAGKKFEDILYEVECSLAKFSLKLPGSTFNVLSIKCDDLDISKQAKTFLARRHVEEVRQLVDSFRFYVSKFRPEEDAEQITKSIKTALRGLGIKFTSKHTSVTMPFNASKDPAQNTEGRPVPKIFPKILESLSKNSENPNTELTNGILETEGIDFSHRVYDYSQLIELINSSFKTKREIYRKLGLEWHTLESIKKGEKVKPSTIKKFCDYFEKSPEEIYKYKPECLKVTIQGVTYDYSVLLSKLFSKYVTVAAIKANLHMSNDTLTKMVNGEPVARTVILKMCIDLGIRARDIITIENPNDEANQPKYKGVPDVDYSQLLLILKQNALSIMTVCERLNIPFANTYNYILQGKHIKPEYLIAIANYLSVPPQELVKINRTIGEIKEKQKAARRPTFLEYDYSRLLNIIYQQYRITNIEEFVKKFNLPMRAAKQITLGRGISYISLCKFSRILHCPPEQLYTPLGYSKSLIPDWPAKACDYTKLFSIIDKNFSSFNEASTKIGIARSLFSRMSKGEILSCFSYAKLMQYFNLSLDELCSFTNPADRKKITSELNRQSKNLGTNDFMDFSKLLNLLKERHISHLKFKQESGIGNTTFSKILDNHRVANYTLKKIIKYLNCGLEDIIDSKDIEGLLPSFKDKPYDYSNFYRILFERDLGIAWLMNQIGISSGYIHCFKQGLKVSDNILNKVCAVLGCTKDDIVKENTEVLERKRREHLEKLRAPRPKKVVAVHTDKLLATALPGTELAEQNAAQPSKTVDALAPLEEIAKTMTSEIDSAESESELAESEDTAPTESAGAGASTNSPNAKFYMGQNGYVNLLSERVKLHSITPNNRTQHLEIDERTL